MAMFTSNLDAQTPTDNLLSAPVNSIVVKGNVTLYLMQGPEQSIHLQGNKSVLKQTKTSVKNKTLHITKNYSLSDERVFVYLTLPSIEQIKSIGDVRIETPTNVWINNLNLDLSEETASTFYINSNHLDLFVSGRGDVNLSGYIDTLTITGTEEAEVLGTIKTLKLICRVKDYSSVSLEGTIFKSFLSGFNQGSIDLTEAECGMSSIVAFDLSKIKVTSIDVTDIYAFDRSVIHYRSSNKAFIMENSQNALIRKENYKTIAKK